MNPRLRSILIGIGLLTMALIAIVLIPRGLSIYFQSRGGQHIDYVLRSVEGIQELVCEPLPKSNQAAIEEVERGIEDLNRAVRINRRSSHSYYQLGKAYCLLGEPDDAVKSYEQYAQLRPDNPLGYIGLGFAYDLLDEPDLARDAWIEAGLKPEDFIKRGKEAYEIQDFSDALFWMKKITNYGRDMRSSEAFLNSKIRTKLGEDESAQELLRIAVEADEGWVDQEIQFLAWYSWGKFLFDQGMYEDADYALSFSLTLYPAGSAHTHPLSEVNRLLGLIYWNNDQPDEAMVFFKEAIDTNHNNTWAHIHYGKFIWESKGESINIVEEEFATALEISPENPSVWESIIRFWNNNGDSKKTKEICEKALNADIERESIPTCNNLNSK